MNYLKKFLEFLKTLFEKNQGYNRQTIEYSHLENFWVWYRILLQKHKKIVMFRSFFKIPEKIFKYVKKN